MRLESANDGICVAWMPLGYQPSLNRGARTGVTLFPFSGGRSLLWDVTCSNNFGTTHVMNCAVKPVAVAQAAEQRKRHRYAVFSTRYRFEPLAVEMTGVLGPVFRKILQELGRRITAETEDTREICWLRQRVSLAVVRGNAAAITSHTKIR